MKRFKTPRKSLGNLDADAAANLIAAAADIALVLDASGVIRDVACGSEETAIEGCADWPGRRWAEIVTIESRPKVHALLQDAAAKTPPRWRQLNHPSSGGPDVPVLYSAVQAGAKGQVVAVGRDLRAVATLQQRLMDAQQSMERDYSRLRHAETRYRLLFQSASEAVLIVDAATQKIVELNPVAGALLGTNAKRSIGRALAECFDSDSAQTIQSALAGINVTGRIENLHVRLSEEQREFVMSASLLRQDNLAVLLVHLRPPPGDAVIAAHPGTGSKLLKLVESSPDGFVVTTVEGRILTANRAFLDLVQVPAEEQVRSETLGRWLGRPGVDFNVLASNLRQHGMVRLFATTLRGEYGPATEVEISGVAVLNTEQPCFGFTIRSVGRRLTGEARTGRQLPKSVEQLTELVGRVTLKDLVREATDVIERLCIEAALELTGDNRASAAEMLGLSRQSLYAKLHRYGLGALATEAEK